MAFIKCPSCGKEIQNSSQECMYCKFDMTNFDRDTRIKIIVQDPNILPLGGSTLSIYNSTTGALLTDVKLGDIFYLTISEPTEISVTKTAWKTGKAILRAKPNATYKIMLKTGFLSSKIIIKDITDSPDLAGKSKTINDNTTQNEAK